MSKLYLKKTQLTEMFTHCRETFPNEACGILAGKDEQVDKIYPTKNVSPTPYTRYLIDPQEQFKIFKEIEKENLEMLAIYHSHTHTHAYPSKTDCELANYPDVFYLIISLVNPKEPVVKSYSIVDGKIKEEEVEIND
ncbi:MAG TPA: hypothetical protein DHV62_01425 [Elusimicrobia bacterium]|jgi:proteasome lid subunit RPN8/RPN11|nr:hypothetical protein [Elusimicrobiota bacterium]